MRGPEAGFKAMACLLGSQGSAGVGGGTRMPILFPLCFMKEGFHKMTVEPL